MDGPQIARALKVKMFRETGVASACAPVGGRTEAWARKGCLTVRQHGSLLRVATDRDGFLALAASCRSLSACGDDERGNDGPEHFHHDGLENTKGSLGVTLYYWQHPQR